ncbi:C40 family peptidase [Winogradskya humida]|uniref:C40 family peptidase n=1 Tax=Winogradskya humida TaxID=113566 RepID=UPI001941E8E3|nr:NlpC/P60 family protein [Actinoplanes humidus]
MPTLARALAAAVLSALLLTGPAAFASPLKDKPTAAELDKQIAAAARQLEVIVEQYNNSREDLRATRERTRSLGVTLRPLTRALGTRQALMDDLMSRTYQRTRSGPTVTLLASANPHEFVDKLLILNQLATTSRNAAKNLRRARADVVSTRTTLNALAAQQRTLELQLITRKATVTGEINTLRQMRSLTYAGSSRFGPSPEATPPPYIAGAAGRVVDFAFAQLGKPYSWGADGPNAYDCSGLTMDAWQQAGINLPHNAARQYGSLPHVSRSDLRPGDLVFFYAPISHVGVYIGDGKMIHAPEYGENIRIATIDTQPISGFGRP